jgi:hypothetical protein
MKLLRRFFIFAHSVPYCDLAFAPSRDRWSAWNWLLGSIPWLFILPYALISLIPLVGTFHGHNALEIFDRWTKRPINTYRRIVDSRGYRESIKPAWERLWKRMEKGFVIGSYMDLFSTYVKFGQSDFTGAAINSGGHEHEKARCREREREREQSHSCSVSVSLRCCSFFSPSLLLSISPSFQHDQVSARDRDRV